MEKRGQFFILTAVILSTLLFSLAFTVNEVVTVERENRFYDYSGAVEREAKNVIDYQVYQGFSSTEELDGFVKLLQQDFRDKAIDSNFMIIYGNNQSITIKNLGTQGINVSGTSGGAPKTLNGASDTLASKIRIAGISSVEALNFRNDDTELRVYTHEYVNEIKDMCPCEQDTCSPDEIETCIFNEFGKSLSDVENAARENFDTVFQDGEIVIVFDEHDYTFPITESNQVIFIIQRDIEEETFVDVR